MNSGGTQWRRAVDHNSTGTASGQASRAWRTKREQRGAAPDFTLQEGTVAYRADPGRSSHEAGSLEAAWADDKHRGVVRPRIPAGTYFWSTRRTRYYSATGWGRWGCETEQLVTKSHLDIPVGTLLGPSLGELHTVGHVRALVKEPTSGRKLSVPCWAACNGMMLVELCRTTDQWRPRAATYRPLAEY